MRYLIAWKGVEIQKGEARFKDYGEAKEFAEEVKGRCPNLEVWVETEDGTPIFLNRNPDGFEVEL